jgi:RAB6A-GEF complex partner protein 2
MDITSSLHQTHPAPQHRRRPTHGRSSSFSSGFLSLLSPTSLVASTSAPPGSPTPWTPMSAGSSSSRLGSGTFAPPSSALGSFPSPKGVGLGLGLPGSPVSAGAGEGTIVAATESVDEEIDPDEPLPTFEVQPAMLAVDLSLMPGESRSCGFFMFFCGIDVSLIGFGVIRQIPIP